MEVKHNLKSYIDFANNNVQEQAIWQMLPTILSKRRSQEQLLSEKDHHHIPELQVLWDNCTDPSHVIALAAVGVLVELVSQHVADYNYVMNGFCNRAIPPRNLVGPIHGVTRLLCLQINNTTNSSPYSLRSTPHPFIGILGNSVNAWAVLLQEIQNLLEHSQGSHLLSTFKMLEPFFIYVLLNPKRDYAICRALYSLFSNLARDLSLPDNQELLDSILDLVIKHVNLFQKSVISLGHHISLCHETLQWMLTKDGDFFVSLFSQDSQ